MNISHLLSRIPEPLRQKRVVAALALALGAILLYLLVRPSGSELSATSYHRVRQGDFTVSIVEGGTLNAVSEVIIRNEVEGVARIISLVPEGSYVKKGDLLVELDSAQAEDSMNQQLIAFEKAKFLVEQATAQVEIQRSATNSDYLAAQLKLKLAILDLDKYDQGQKMVDEIEARNKVLEAEANRTLNLDSYVNSTNLASKGYETRRVADTDRLNLLRSENAAIMATNNLWMLQTFDQVKQREKFLAEVMQSEQELARVVVQNARKMAQFHADLISQQNTLALNEQKLERDKRNLAATKIYAPQDGLVVYQMGQGPFSSESMIEGGATVRNRQELIKLPDLSRMKVTVKVHESHVNLVRPGLPAYVILDPMPEQRFPGVVEKVAPLPDSQSRWGNPNLKVYTTEIYLTEAIPNIKPGVSARAEIIVTNVANAISVPIQAVTSLKGKQVVYLANGGRPEPKPVELGMYNTKFIQVTSGLKNGDRVLLSPPFDAQEKDLEGGVLAADEKASAASNAPPRQPVPAEPDEPSSGNIAPLASGDPAQQVQVAGAPNGEQPRRAAFNPEEMLKQFDKNGDGQLDDSEREAMRAARGTRGGPPGGFNREEMMKQFDKNGDGQIDDTEREAMRSSFGNRGSGEGRRSRGPSDTAPDGGSALSPREPGRTPPSDATTEPVRSTTLPST